MKKCRGSANFTPCWFCNDDSMQFTDKLLADDRVHKQYIIRDFFQANVEVSFGSDAPISSVNPLHAIETAVTHQEVDGNQDVWNPSQLITLEEAIYCFTMGSSYANHIDHITGSLEVGKKADFIVLDKNLFSINPKEIHKVSVQLVAIGGKIVLNKLS